MIKQTSMKRNHRITRHKRIRAKISGTRKKPRLAVFRSRKYLWLQIIDDEKGRTLVAVSDREIKSKKSLTKTERAGQVAELLAKKVKEKGIREVVFDRGGFKYHGRIKALAEALRQQGIKF